MYFIKTKQLSYNISAEEIQMSRVIEQIKTGLSYSFFNPLRLSNIVSFRSPAWGGGEGPGDSAQLTSFGKTVLC